MMTHDDKGQILSVTAQAAGQPLKYAQGRITQYRYNSGLSQPDQRIDPAGHVLRYEYDTERNLTALIRPPHLHLRRQ